MSDIGPMITPESHRRARHEDDRVVALRPCPGASIRLGLVNGWFAPDHNRARPFDWATDPEMQDLNPSGTVPDTN